MGDPCFFVVLSSLLLLIVSTQTSSAQLTRGFYLNTCPNVEQLVRSAVEQKFQQTFVTAPATLRLFFHDCFVRGCDASILLASPNNKAEKDHPDDISLAGDGFDTVAKAKAAVDSDPQCRNKVSCADILALATRDVINLAGGPFYKVELGRRDGRISTIASVQRQLPHPDFNLDKLNSIVKESELAGKLVMPCVIIEPTCHVLDWCAHTIGFSHCNHFSRRIYNFSPKKLIDPTLNLHYAFQLRQSCPLRVDSRIAINMDPVTPQKFDNQYFKNLQQGMGLFTSDQVLATDERSRGTINLFASNEQAFYNAFIEAITKMGRIGVKTGRQGEIRFDCSRVN
uniref:Peroxidase n=1 Tax=Glycine max TaxID=3847 RepID=A0A0R0GAY5_SOYBN